MFSIPYTKAINVQDTERSDNAGEEQADVDLFLQRFVCKGRIASTQYYVPTKNSNTTLAPTFARLRSSIGNDESGREPMIHEIAP